MIPDLAQATDIEFVRPWMLLFIPLLAIVVVGLNRLLHGRSIGLGRMPTTMRIGCLGLLAVTIAAPVLPTASGASATVFLLDRSDSFRGAPSDTAYRWVNETLEGADMEHSAAVITFGAEPEVTIPPGPAPVVAESLSPENDDDFNSNGTNIGSALTLANALPAGNDHVVLISDGEETAGDAIGQLPPNLTVDILPLSGALDDDLRIASVSGPTSVWEGDPVQVSVTVGIGAAGPATLDVIDDEGNVVLSEEHELAAGETTLSLEIPDLEPGFHGMEVRVSGEAAQDPIPENNAAPIAVVVRDAPRVLIVSPEGGDTTALRDAISTSGAEIEEETAAEIPGDAAGFAAYDTIVLDNVPAWALSEAQQRAIVEHTRNGGGLIANGGTLSYGPGSYAGTTLEQALPVTVRVTDGRERPRVAVLIVMDTSGSMSAAPAGGGATQLDLAKDGVVTASSALTEGDMIGLISFTDQPEWAMDMTTLTGEGDQQRVASVIEPLEAGGGTEIYPALSLAYDSLQNVNADVRHIILLSDGRSNTGTDESYSRLLENAAQDRVTVSALGIGDDADQELLTQITSDGFGRFHEITNPEDIPQVTFQEARSVGSQSVLRGQFAPIQQLPSPILNDIDPASMPLVEGYNFTAARSGAQEVLTSDRGDPLLATWQYGLGRTVAWTSDTGDDLAAGWRDWDGYVDFWNSALTWALPDPERQALSASVDHDGQDAEVTLIANQGAGDDFDLDALEFQLTGPDGSISEPEVTRTAPDAAMFRLPSAEPAAWQLDINGEAQSDTIALAVGLSPEWQSHGDGERLLMDLAEQSGGDVLSLDESAPPDLFDRYSAAGVSSGEQTPLWAIPLALALVVFLMDIAWQRGFIPLRSSSG